MRQRVMFLAIGWLLSCLACVPSGQYNQRKAEVDSLRNELAMEQYLNDRLQEYVSEVYYRKVEPRYTAAMVEPSTEETSLPTVSTQDLTPAEPDPSSTETAPNQRKAQQKTRGVSPQKTLSKPAIWSDQIFFERGSTQLSETSQEAMVALAELLKANKHIHLSLRGHTDNTEIQVAKGATDTWELSTQRASSVGRFLIASGVSPLRIQTTGKGKFEPQFSNGTTDGQQKNRRVEILLIPTSQ
ncbi:MAG: OmpA family protein [Bacteroidota bacterium]